jgi:hypothetical protein
LNPTIRKMILFTALALVAMPSLAPRAQKGTPAATAAACVATPPAGPATDTNVRQQVILDEMRGHLLASLQLWQAGSFEQASVHAAHPAQELLPALAGDLRHACLLDGLTKALTGYFELSSGPGDAGKHDAAHNAILSMLDQASATLIPAQARSDPAFNFRVIAALLSDVQKEYAESFKDGKIAQLPEYQDSVGFYQAARARYDSIKAALAPELAQSLDANWTTLSAALQTVKAPDQPADPSAISGAVDSLIKAGAKALNVSVETKLTPLEYLNNAQRALQEAMELYEKGDKDEAYEEAASAYLEQFENAEPALMAKDKELMETIEGQMKDFRDAIKAGKPVDEVRDLLSKINANIEKAMALLSQ